MDLSNFEVDSQVEAILKSLNKQTLSVGAICTEALRIGLPMLNAQAAPDLRGSNPGNSQDSGKERENVKVRVHAGCPNEDALGFTSPQGGKKGPFHSSLSSVTRCVLASRD